MRRRHLLAVVLALCCATALPAQTDAPTATKSTERYGGERPFLPFGSNRFGLDLTLIQPGGFFMLDKGSDDPGELDLFKDGKMTVTVQLAGADVGYRLRQNTVRLGGNLGVGVSTAATPEYCRTGAALDACPTTERVASASGGVLIYNTGLFVQFRDLMRFEWGRIQGISGVENLDRSKRDDSAWYFGVSFNTTLGDALENLIRGDTTPDTSDDKAKSKANGK